MEIEFASWLNMALRWFHLIAGAAWVGASFYFIWLDNSLNKPKNKEDKKSGVTGELWAVHGGGFYHNKKYQVAPEHMPEDLHWFKWEAYFTWITGFLLLALIYYHGASMYLIDESKLALEPWQAISIGLGFIGGGWLFYDTLCKTKIGEDNRLFGIIWFAALTAAAYVLTQIFTDRGAFIHVGAIIGSVMAFNVFMIIIPNQRIVVADLIAGRTPDPALGEKAKQRSTHNNYMSLPVLLIMLSNHYPVMVSHEYNWLILAGMGVVAWAIRHFFNLHHKGKVDYSWPVLGVIGFIIIMLLASYNPDAGSSIASGDSVSVAEVRTIIRNHCATCHSDTPTHEAFDVAPAGIMFDKMDEIRKHAARIKAQSVDSDLMPLGNETGMSDEERRKLGVWIDGLD
jgi:uncharacterized membrane protein